MSYSGIQQQRDGSIVLFLALSKELYEDLQKSAEESSLSIIEMVNQAIENEIYEDETEPTKTSESPKK